MEFYNDSPFTNLFNDHSVVLSGGREQDEVTREWTFTEKIFYASYCLADKSISLSVFDDETREYLRGPVYVRTFHEAALFVKEIAAEFPKKIAVKKLLAEMELYFTAMSDSAAFVEGRVTEVNYSCDQCGDYNTDEFIFLYVPAVPDSKLTEASLGLHWKFGCFGGRKSSGVFEDVVDEVQEMLEDMLEGAKTTCKPEIREALSVLANAKVATAAARK